MSGKRILRRPLPVVALVGRPNVGKSTMFNRLTGTRKAVVHDTPGLTRDRNYLPAEWEGREFLLVDTGGYETDSRSSEILRQMRGQTLLAVDEADTIIFLVDLMEPNNPVDEEVMQLLRKSGKPVLVAVNKCDSLERRNMGVAEFGRFVPPDALFTVSALHGNGTNDLLDAVLASLPAPEDDDEEGDLGVRIAVVGRPNVGKSTLVNKILGFERTIANPMPGTTRDSIDTTFERGDRIYTIIDTAGIRRRGKVERGPEKLSVLASLLSLQRCDIALVLIDGEEGLTDQDAHVAGHAVDAGCGMVLVVNKWDLVPKTNKTADDFAKEIRHQWGFLKDIPIIFISAAKGQRVEKLFEFVDAVAIEYTREIETRELNEWLGKTTKHLSPPIRSGKQLKMKYVTQTGTRPPTFTFFVNDPKLIHFSYERYLANQLRREFGFEGVPIRLRFKAKAEPRTFHLKSKEK